MCRVVSLLWRELNRMQSEFIGRVSVRAAWCRSQVWGALINIWSNGKWECLDIFCKSRNSRATFIYFNQFQAVISPSRNPGHIWLWSPSCLHFACTVALLEVGNNLSIKVLGCWVTFAKYLCLIVRLHKSHVMLGAWASSASARCYFQTSLVMPTRIFGLLGIKFRAVSATSPQSPPETQIKRTSNRISGEVIQFNNVQLLGDWS